MKPQTTDDIFALLDIYITSAALGAAMERSLFWLLAEQPLDAAAVAQALGIPPNRCRYWLDLLHNVDLVGKTPAGYVPSPIAQSAILDAFSQETWAFLAGESRERFPAVRNLTAYFGEPGSTWAAQGLTPPDYFAAMVQNPDRARRFTRMLYEIHLPLAHELAKSLDLHGVRRLLDLGGGSGVNAMALLRQNPQLSAVVVDIPNVCAAGRELAAENALEERVTYQAANFLHEEIPSGFDMILACDVGVNDKALLRKLGAALNPGGRLVIVDQFAPAAGEVPRSWLNWAFLASLENPRFCLSTTDNLKNNLAQAGFQVLSERLLPHGDVQRWSSDWTVIEAR